MQSNHLTQVELPLKPLDFQVVRNQQSLCAAVALCAAVSGKKDKQIYSALDIDAGHWSRIRKGDAHFPLDKLSTLMDICGNEAPVLWLVHQRGYDVDSLRRRQTETERQLETERAARVAAEQKLEVFKELLRETRPV